MNSEKLELILNKTSRNIIQFDKVVKEICSNYQVMDIPPNFSSYYNFLLFDYTEFGFTFKDGQIGVAGIFIRFTHVDYEELTVQLDYYRGELLNYCLLRPKFNVNHFIKGKRTQTANTIRNDKDFERYIKKINKQFPL